MKNISNNLIKIFGGELIVRVDENDNETVVFKKKRHYYNFPFYMATVGFVRKRIEYILKQLDEYDDELNISELDNFVKKDIIKDIEECSDVVRYGIEQSGEGCFLCDIYDDEGVKVKVVEDVISVFTPLTFHRKKYEYKSLAKKVAIALDKFENENLDLNLRSLYRKPGSTCNVFQVRMVHNFKAYLKDNNNENGAIINEILGNRLLRSDNPQSMVTYTDICVQVTEEYPVGVLHLVIPTDKLEIYLNDIFTKRDFFKFM